MLPLLQRREPRPSQAPLASGCSVWQKAPRSAASELHCTALQACRSSLLRRLLCLSTQGVLKRSRSSSCPPPLQPRATSQHLPTLTRTSLSNAFECQRLAGPESGQSASLRRAQLGCFFDALVGYNGILETRVSQEQEVARRCRHQGTQKTTFRTTLRTCDVDTHLASGMRDRSRQEVQR